MRQNHTLHRLISSSFEAEISQETSTESPLPTGPPSPRGGFEGFLDPALTYGGLAVVGTLAVTALIKALTELVKAIQD